MKFSQLVDACAPTLRKIYKQKFNASLYSGTLPKPLFNLFLTQDVFYYLPKYAQALREIGSDLNNPANLFFHPVQAEQFIRLADVTVAYEKDIISRYAIQQQGSSCVFFQSTPVTDCLVNYTRYLLDKTESIALRVTKVTACLWLYAQLGKQMDPSLCSVDNPYLSWIKAYRDPAFLADTDALIRTLDHVLGNVNCLLQENQIIAAFEKSLEFEWAFFDSFYPEEERLALQIGSALCLS